MNILIATPAYGGVVTTAYFSSMMQFLRTFEQKHPQVGLASELLDHSLLAMARNYFISRLLNDSSLTHVLFIDADMGFGAQLIEDMIAFDKPVAGCLYPKRAIDLQNLYYARDSIPDFNTALCVAMDYAGADRLVMDVTHEEDGKNNRSLTLDRGFVRSSVAGTGIMLIKKEAALRLKEAYPQLYREDDIPEYRKMGLTEGGVLQVFSDLANEHGVYVGEDYAFCKRWVEGCGGEIWLNTAHAIAHVGNMTYYGHYLQKAQAGFF